jgi:hypothetical protein
MLHDGSGDQRRNALRLSEAREQPALKKGNNSSAMRGMLINKNRVTAR